MKILFVCSCLEPGRDGVGDYTRRLAVELQARGHRCSLLALADSHVSHATATELVHDAGPIPCLRLPRDASWPERIRHAKTFCEKVAPDWISWQLVLYGFDPRGLSFGLGGRFREIAAGRKSQIMFHEIWIGEAEQASLKTKIVGRLQRFIIRDLLRKLRPGVVHTHTPLYQQLLDRLGPQVKLLPLFGNIPLERESRPEWLAEKWPKTWGPFDSAQRRDWWIFVMFGTVHPEWDASDFFNRAGAAAQRAGKKCAFIAIGRLGAAGDRLMQELQQRDDGAWRFLNLGEQPGEEISQCLLAADFGVTAVPPEYLFKSGTAAAMIEHGLPVIATRPTYRYAGQSPETLVAGLKNIVRDFDLEPLRKSEACALLPSVATQFVGDLEQADRAPRRP